MSEIEALIARSAEMDDPPDTKVPVPVAWLAALVGEVRRLRANQFGAVVSFSLWREHATPLLRHYLTAEKPSRRQLEMAEGLIREAEAMTDDDTQPQTERGKALEAAEVAAFLAASDTPHAQRAESEGKRWDSRQAKCSLGRRCRQFPTTPTTCWGAGL